MPPDNELSPVALFAYNRPQHICRTLAALKRNKLASETNLVVFVDGPKDESDFKAHSEVLQIIGAASGFKDIEIVQRAKNLGLANNIIDGVTRVLQGSSKIIVLEDDLITHPEFLRFMNNALDYYENDSSIMSVSAYSYPNCIPDDYRAPVYIFHRAMSWGWGTWKRYWDIVDWDMIYWSGFFANCRMQKQFNKGGEDLTYLLYRQHRKSIDSWAIRWCFAHFRENAYSLHPTRSLIFNEGFDGSGAHCAERHKRFNQPLPEDQVTVPLMPEVSLNEEIARNIRKQFSPPLLSVPRAKMYLLSLKALLCCRPGIRNLSAKL